MAAQKPTRRALWAAVAEGARKAELLSLVISCSCDMQSAGPSTHPKTPNMELSRRPVVAVQRPDRSTEPQPHSRAGRRAVDSNDLII